MKLLEDRDLERLSESGSYDASMILGYRFFSVEEYSSALEYFKVASNICTDKSVVEYELGAACNQVAECLQKLYLDKEAIATFMQVGRLGRLSGYYRAGMLSLDLSEKLDCFYEGAEHGSIPSKVMYLRLKKDNSTSIFSRIGLYFLFYAYLAKFLVLRTYDKSSFSVRLN